MDILNPTLSFKRKKKEFRILEERSKISQIDHQDMLALIENFPEQCVQAVKIGESFNLPHYRAISHLVIVGMGGSGIGGELLADFTRPDINLPVIVNRHYSLPQFVNQKSLVLICSYSGNTEEVLQAWEDARKRRAKIIAVTTGGKLAQQAKMGDIPVLYIPFIGPPRSALGYSFFPLLVVLQRFKLIPDRKLDITETIEVLMRLKNKFSPEGPAPENLAKQLAIKLYGYLPVIYGSQDTTSAVGSRWRTQLNENSKTIAFSNVIPELNHNEIVGWEHSQEFTQHFQVIILRDRTDNPRVQKRQEITQRIIRKDAAGITEIMGEGNSFLARMFSLIYLGDFVSFYLAILKGVDPSTVNSINFLKKSLEEVH